MMTMAISHQQIFAAADALNARGVRPTLSAVRKELGTGSYTTISEGMAAWRSAQEQKKQTLAVPLPEEVAQGLANLGDTVWQAALAVASAQLDLERGAHKEQVQALAQAQNEAVQLADSLEDELAAAKATCEQLTLTSQQLAATNQANEVQLASLQVKLDAESMRANEGALQLAILESELTRLREVNSQLSNALARLGAGPVGVSAGSGG